MEITQQVLRLREEQELHVIKDDLVKEFEHNFNPQKGETRDGEINRWLKFIWESHGITNTYISPDRICYFKRIGKGNGL